MRTPIRLIAILALCASRAHAQRSAKYDAASWDGMTIAALHDEIREGRLTCTQAVETHLDRIRAFDLDISAGPPINAFVTINPRIREEARALDLQFKQTGRLVGPLHCVPLGVKDIFFTEGMPTTNGMLVLADAPSRSDGFVVARLRAAGALVLGKTALDEDQRGVAGLSSISGRVGDACDPWQNPGGSSAGTASAVAASFVLAGLGADACSSIIEPAAHQGLVGLRPSVGLVTQHGMVPCCELDGAAGPIARTVPDLARILLLGAAQGVWWNARRHHCERHHRSTGDRDDCADRRGILVESLRDVDQDWLRAELCWLTSDCKLTDRRGWPPE